MFGASKSRSTQSSKSNEALDPQLKAALLGNFHDVQAMAAKPYQPYSGEMVAGFTPTQTQGQQGLLDIAANHTGSGLLSDAATTAKGVAGYHPTSVTAPTIDRGLLGDVSNGAVGADQINAFQNPYQDQVIQHTLDDLDRQRKIDQVGNASRATIAGGRFGAGDVLQHAATDEGFYRARGSTEAGLLDQGFNTALTAAQAQAQRQQQAEQANQSTSLAAAGQNASNGLQGLLANQQADQAGAQIQAQGAGLLGNLSDQELNQGITREKLVSAVGDAQQALAQSKDTAEFQAWMAAQQWPIQMQQLVNQSLGLAGDPTLTQSESQGKATSSSANGGLAPKG